MKTHYLPTDPLTGQSAATVACGIAAKILRRQGVPLLVGDGYGVTCPTCRAWGREAAERGLRIPGLLGVIEEE